jgi:hypothetical protein
MRIFVLHQCFLYRRLDSQLAFVCESLKLQLHVSTQTLGYLELVDRRANLGLTNVSNPILSYHGVLQWHSAVSRP